MKRALLLAVAILFAGAIAWIALGLPRAESTRLLTWITAVAGAVAAIGLLASIALSSLERSDRFTEARQKKLERLTGFAVQLSGAGFCAFLAAKGPLLMIEGSIGWGVVLLGAFAVIVVLCLLAPSEV